MMDDEEFYESFKWMNVEVTFKAKIFSDDENIYDDIKNYLVLDEDEDLYKDIKLIDWEVINDE